MLFARAFLHQDLWDQQNDVLTSVASNPQTAVKACHASGKTWVAAQAVLWWLARWPDGIALTTAPTWLQVTRLLWGDIKQSVATSTWPFPEPLATELRISPNNYALGLSTDEGNRFQGFHGKILIVVDEAPGVRGGIFEAVAGIQAGGDVRLLYLGNPTVPSGPFYDCFGASTWNCITIDAYNTPNLLGVPGDTPEAREQYLAQMPPRWDKLSERQKSFLQEVVRPYLVTRQWCWEKLHSWGTVSGVYQSRVRGRFPIEGANSMFSFSSISEARETHKPDEFDEIEAGLDVAGPGKDETVLYIRQGPVIRSFHAWHLPDPKRAIMAALEPYRKSVLVKVDVAGIGYHVWRALKDDGFDARPFHPQKPARENSRFHDAKAEAAWALRTRLDEGDVFGLRDQETIDQLISINYGHDDKGRVIIESKKVAQKRGVASPDRAEALIMAFAPLSAPPLRCF